MRKNVAITIISVLAVLAVALGILYFTNNVGKQKEIDNLTADVSEKASQIETLNADVADRDGQIKALNDDVADRDGQIKTLNADIADKSKQIDTLNADVTDRDGQIKTLNADIADKSKQIDTLNADVADRDGQIKTLNADIADKSKQIDTLNADVADRDDQIKTLNADVTYKSGQIEALTADVANKAGQIETLTADVAYKSNQIEALTADVANKASQIETLTEDAANKASQIETLTEDVTNKAAQIETLTEDVANKASQIETLTADAANKASQIEALTADVANKASQIETLNENVAGKNEQITALYNKVVKNDKEIEGLRDENASKDVKIKTLTEELQLKDKETVTLKEQNEEKDRTIEKLQLFTYPESAPVPIFPQDASESKSDEEKENAKAEVKEDIKFLAADVKAAKDTVKEDVKEAAREVKAAVEEKAEEKKEEIKEAAKDVKAIVEEKAEDVKAAVGEKEEKKKEEETKPAEGAETTAAAAAKSLFLPDMLIKPMTLTEKVTLNKENLGMLAGMLLRGDEARIAKLNQLIDFVNGLEYKVLYDGMDAEGFISTKGEDLASFLMLRDEDGLKLYSDMFPSYCFDIRREDIKSVMPQTSVDVDPAKLAEAFAAPMMKLLSGIRFGAPETVEETLFDTEFTARTPIDMTLKEMALLGLNTAREVMENEEIAKLLVSLKDIGVDFSVEQIDEVIKSVEASKEEEQPTIDAGMYTNSNNDLVIKVDVSQDGEIISHSVGGKIGENGMSEIQVGDQVYIYVRGGKEGVNIIIRFQGMEMGIDVIPETRANGTAFVATVSMMGMEMAKVETEILNDVTLTGKFNTEGRENITVKDFRQKKELAEEISKDYLMNYKPALDEKLQKIAPEMISIFEDLMNLVRNAVQTMPSAMIQGM